MALHVSETIQGSRAIVWAVMTDWPLARYWLGVEGLRPMEKSQPVGEGSRLLFTARGAAHQSTITKWEPDRALTLESVQGGVSAVHEYTLEDEGGATRVTLRADCRAEGWFWRLLLPGIRWLMGRADAGQLAALRSVVDHTVATAERRAHELEGAKPRATK